MKTIVSELPEKVDDAHVVDIEEYKREMLNEIDTISMLYEGLEDITHTVIQEDPKI